MEEIQEIVGSCIKKLLDEYQLVGYDFKEVELFGSSGLFNSLAIMALVIEIEEEVLRTKKMVINLTDENSFDGSSSPFRNYDSICYHVLKVKMAAIS